MKLRPHIREERGWSTTTNPKHDKGLQNIMPSIDRRRLALASFM